MKPHLICVALAWVVLLPAGKLAAQTSPPNTAAKLLADFTTRVQQYADMRTGFEKADARLKTTDDTAKLAAAQEALAQKIRTARAGAKIGDFFTPELRPVFRRLLNPKLTGSEGVDNKSAISDTNPGALPIKVNGPYPKSEPLSTIPPDVLRTLPPLPEGITYRFVGKHLTLYDAHASLILDFIPNAL